MHMSFVLNSSEMMLLLKQTFFFLCFFSFFGSLEAICVCVNKKVLNEMPAIVMMMSVIMKLLSMKNQKCVYCWICCSLLTQLCYLANHRTSHVLFHCRLWNRFYCLNVPLFLGGGKNTENKLNVFLLFLFIFVGLQIFSFFILLTWNDD